MNELNKAELRRLVQMLRDNADQCACAGFSSSLQDKAAEAVLSLLDECDRKDAELSACKEHPGGCGYWREAARMLEQERDAALAELEACRKDAERYRKLRGAAVRAHGIGPDKFDAEFDVSLEAIELAMS